MHTRPQIPRKILNLKGTPINPHNSMQFHPDVEKNVLMCLLRLENQKLTKAEKEAIFARLSILALIYSFNLYQTAHNVRYAYWHEFSAWLEEKTGLTPESPPNPLN